MLRKIYRELVRIRKELHTIRSNMESLSELDRFKSVVTENTEVRTNVDDHPTACHAGKINVALHDLTNRIYRGDKKQKTKALT